MTTVKQTIILLTLTVLGLTSCKQKQTTEIRDDFKRYYDQFNVDGSFVLYDPQDDKYVFYNQNQFEQTFSPASTYKICNSLIGLETGVIKDENFVIPWDSVTRQNPNWNADTSGGIDKFWLTGGLRISPKQQIDFLKRLHENQLPFSQRSVDIVKNIMIAKDTLDYVVRAKTGWCGQDNKDIGWYVGYLETNNKVYYFANCIQSSDINNKDFANARIDIVYLILKELKLIDQ